MPPDYPSWPPAPPEWILIEVEDGKTRYTRLAPNTPENRRFKIPDPTRWHV